MPFRWEVDPQDLFTERYPQMLSVGLPAPDVDRVRAAITEMWGDEPGAWVHEWSALAARYAAEGRPGLAALGYGFAKFPALADDDKRAAFDRQREQYLLATPDFPVGFERRELTGTPVHILRAAGVPADAPVLLASGGVDSWKMDLDGIFLALALSTPAQVVLFDIPGTGENPVPLNQDGLRFTDELIDAARGLGDGRVAHLGISMGGYFSAYTGLTGQVDASVVLGGPVEATLADPQRRWAFGMDGIVGNVLGLAHPPTPAELLAATAPLSLRPLLDQDKQGPMLVINGADDVHVPRHDTLVFEGRRDTEVELIPGTGHCAISVLDRVLPKISGWLNDRLR